MTSSLFATLSLFILLQVRCYGKASYFDRFIKYNNISSDGYQKLKGDMVQYREGDVIIGVLARVHDRGESSSCDEVLEDGIQAVETVNMIIDMLNENQTILPGVTIGTVMIDTCNIDTHAVQRMVQVFLPFFSGNEEGDENIPLFAGVVGATSSGVSIQTAGLLQAFEIPQVSPSSTNSELSDKDRYPYFFRAVPPDTFQAAAIVGLLKKQGWNYFSIVYGDDSYGRRGFLEIEQEATNQDICLASNIPIPRSPDSGFFDEAVEKLLEFPKAKVVIIFAERVDAENLIRAANANPTSRGYFTWVGTDGWTEQLPIGNKKDYLESLNGSLGFGHKTDKIDGLDAYIENQTITINPTPWAKNNRNPWFPEMLTHSVPCYIAGISSNNNVNLCSNTDHLQVEVLTRMQNVADSVYAIVHSLDQHVRAVCGERICSNINRTAGTNQLAQNVYRRMKNISFRGINENQFKFDVNYDGPAEFYLLQLNAQSSSEMPLLEQWIRRGQYVDGNFTWISDNSTVENILSRCSDPCKEGQAQASESSVCCWLCRTCKDYQYVRNGTECVDCPEGHVPSKDRKTCEAVDKYFTGFSDPHGIASSVIAAIGLALNVFVAATFCMYRNTAIVRATGRESCWFILIGATLCFLNSFVLHSYPTTAQCAFSRIFLAIGAAMMYAAIVTKTIRILVIFHSKGVLSKQVKEFLLPKYQILVTFLLLFLQLCIVAFWFGIDLPHTTTIYPNREIVLFACSDVEGLGALIGYAYPFLLIIACTVLATLNRKVPTGFNETQYIGFTMYATCVIWLSFIVIFIANPDNIPLKIATLAISLNLSAITVLVCLFGYRCYVMILKPSENNSKAMMSSVNTREGISETSKSENISNEGKQRNKADAKTGRDNPTFDKQPNSASD